MEAEACLEAGASLEGPYLVGACLEAGACLEEACLEEACLEEIESPQDILFS